MKHTPITKQRSDWHPIDTPTPPYCTAWERHVTDGLLTVFVGDEPGLGWHLSISHRRPTAKGVRLVRYPTWDEIVHARDRLLPPDRDFIMTLPKAGEYVALHDTTFHLHEAR